MVLFNSMRIFPYWWLFEELGDTSKSTALVLMRDYNLQKSAGSHHTADTTQVAAFFKTLVTSLQKRREPAGKDSSIDLLPVNREDLVSGDRCLSWPQWPQSGWVKNLCWWEGKSQQNLNSGHEESRLLRELLSKILHENVWADAGVHQC